MVSISSENKNNNSGTARRRSDQRGIAHLALIVILVAVLVAVVGVVGYKVVSSNKDKDSNASQNSTSDSVAAELAKIDCPAGLNDDDLCKFYKSFKVHNEYRMKSTSSDGSNMTIEVEGDNSYSMMTGAAAYEAMQYNKASYVKAGDTWYKYPAQSEQAPKDTGKVELDEPTTDTSTTEEDKTVYKKIGKEACGNLQCFKYQIIDPSDADTTQFIWFDDKDYQMRKMTSKSAEGVTTEMTFEYDNVNIKAPSPVKELAANQYVMPGSNEVMTMPDVPVQ